MAGNKKDTLVNFRDIFSIGNFFSKTVGLLPPFHDIPPSTGYSTFFWTSFINLWIAYIGEFIYFFKALGNSSSLLNLTALAPCICFVTMGLNHMTLVHYYRPRLVRIITTLEERFPRTHHEQEELQIEQKKTEFRRFLIFFSTAFVFFILALNYVPLTVALRDYIKTGVFRRVLPYFIWYPFDVLDDKYYLYSYLHQSWAGFTTIFALVAELFLLGSTVLQICIQFEKISTSIRKYKPNRVTDTQFLSQTIAEHHFVLDTADEFCDMFSTSLFINYMSGSMVVCFVLFQVLVGENIFIKIKYLLFMLCSLIQTIVVGKLGNEMIESSTDIASAVYEGEWLQGDPKYRKALMLVMHRAQKPRRLVALKYITVSLNGTTKILYTNYSYFALIRKLYYRIYYRM